MFAQLLIRILINTVHDFVWYIIYPYINLTSLGVMCLVEMTLTDHVGFKNHWLAVYDNRR